MQLQYHYNLIDCFDKSTFSADMENINVKESIKDCIPFSKNFLEILLGLFALSIKCLAR